MPPEASGFICLNQPLEPYPLLMKSEDLCCRCMLHDLWMYLHLFEVKERLKNVDLFLNTRNRTTTPRDVLHCIDTQTMHTQTAQCPTYIHHVSHYVLYQQQQKINTRIWYLRLNTIRVSCLHVHSISRTRRSRWGFECARARRSIY